MQGMKQAVRSWHYGFFVLGIGLLAVVTRLLPHPPNFAPMTALALFSGVAFRNRWVGIGYVLGLMFLSDVLLELAFGFGFHSGMPVVYGSLLLIALLGGTLRKRFHFLAITGMTLLSSVLFFILTNLGVWLFSGMYPHTLDGLVLCYTLAIPFFHNALAGDIVYAALLFGSYAYALAHFPALQASPNAVRFAH